MGIYWAFMHIRSDLGIYIWICLMWIYGCLMIFVGLICFFDLHGFIWGFTCRWQLYGDFFLWQKHQELKQHTIWEVFFD